MIEATLIFFTSLLDLAGLLPGHFFAQSKPWQFPRFFVGGMFCRVFWYTWRTKPLKST